MVVGSYKTWDLDYRFFTEIYKNIFFEFLCCYLVDDSCSDTLKIERDVPVV